MAPQHETDIAKKRWEEDEWRHYELWEQLEVKQRYRRWLWIGVTTVLFFVLSAVPVVMEKWPKWRSVRATRELAQVLNQLKRKAGVEQSPMRLKFNSTQGLDYQIEKTTDCKSKVGVEMHEVINSGHLLSEREKNEFQILPSEAASELQLPGLVNEFCYDPFKENDQVLGFAIIPVKDLSNSRLDRHSLLILSGPSAEISF